MNDFRTGAGIATITIGALCSGVIALGGNLGVSGFVFLALWGVFYTAYGLLSD